MKIWKVSNNCLNSSYLKFVILSDLDWMSFSFCWNGEIFFYFKSRMLIDSKIIVYLKNWAIIPCRNENNEEMNENYVKN